jgi:ADP-dependent phosphofructokinase/glucokinase
VSPENIVLGLGGTVDYEIEWDAEAINKLVALHGIRRDALVDLPKILTERDLLISLSNFLETGIGGERSVAKPEVIHTLAMKLTYRVTLGGTPVRAALVMAVRGVASTVHLVSTNDETRALLPRGTHIVSSATEDSLFPHLIVQYPSGATIALEDGVVRAPRANRVIFTHDPPNEELLLSNQLGGALSGAKLCLVSGLNIFKDEALLRERLVQLVVNLEKVPPTGTVVYEDAGFHIPLHSRIVREMLVPHIDVYSMNEDEAQAYLRETVDLTSSAAVTAMFTKLRAAIPAKHLMVHTHLWAALVGPKANHYRQAVGAAVQMASARFCFGDALTLAQYDSIASLPHNLFAAGVGEALGDAFGEDLAFSPGFLLETGQPTTIGLGDSFIGGFLAELAIQNG